MVARRHRDWHNFRLIREVLVDMILDPKAVSRYAMRYWYEDER